jgi:dihydropteroate synthase
MPQTLSAGPFKLSLASPLVMGVVNVTPDSFSDGGKFLARDDAVAHAHKLIEDGADVLDIGGESTRPGAAPACLAEELDRVLPVIEALVGTSIPLSIDTQKPEVMAAAIRAGAAMVNDVNALRSEGAVQACAASNVAVCLMHMQGQPRTMQACPSYDDVVADVAAYLCTRATVCEEAGITHDRIVLDPGFGFGKTLAHNLALLRQLDEIVSRGYPVMVGLSRKSMFNALLGRATHERLVPSVVSALIAVQKGATILRVHDVAQTCDALKIWAEIGGRCA